MKFNTTFVISLRLFFPPSLRWKRGALAPQHVKHNTPPKSTPFDQMTELKMLDRVGAALLRDQRQEVAAKARALVASWTTLF